MRIAVIPPDRSGNSTIRSFPPSLVFRDFMGDLTPNFSRDEFRCRCGCGTENIDLEFVQRLQNARNRLGPLRVLSGSRCRDHNRCVGGSENSSHLAGWAADLACSDSRSRFELVNALQAVGLRRIGMGNNFVHVDFDSAKSQRVLWLY